jgi:hypothetical protein
MQQEPIPITGLWINSNASGTEVTIRLEIDGQFWDIAVLEGSGNGVISHIIEPNGIRSLIDTVKYWKVVDERGQLVQKQPQPIKV